MTEPLMTNNGNPPDSKKVLIIDDDGVTRLTVKTILKKSGYEVTEATNGREGFSLFMEIKPDLVLMDVVMPEMDGYAATQAIRHYEKHRSTPIIMLTSLDDINSIDQAFDAGATDFITKPINWSLLSQRIKYTVKASETEEKLLTSQAQLKFSQQLAKVGYWEWDIKNDLVSGSKSVFDLFAIPPRTGGMSMEQFSANILPKDLVNFQKVIADTSLGISNGMNISFRVNHQDNSIAHIDCLSEVIFDQNKKPIKIMGSAQDITRLHKAESLISYQANHDNLTGLPNRTFFNDTLDKHLNKTLPNKINAIIALDIDRFKKVNDSLGQKKGDNLLSSVAKRLTRVTREADFIARLGSDEFVILVKDAKNIQELNQSIVRIYKDLTRVYIINAQEIFITFSLGISILGQDGNNTSDLVAHANVARSEAKLQGGDQFLFYQAAMNIESKKELLLENDLRKALERDEIEVYYQPQVYGKTLQPYGAEALVRWNHSTEGIISPAVFIPMAESSELIVDIGLYVLKTAIKEAENWHQQGFKNLHIGINLSGRQFANNELIKNVQLLLANSTLPAKYLDLEITESLAMSNADHNIRILKALKALGVSISIDDFGTGYSSLSYLHSFPIDTIKIDRSFITNSETSEGQAIVKTIIAMANSLNLSVVAEGIEKESHVKILQERSCDIFQGYKFGKPMQAKDFQKYLDNQTKT